MQKKIVGLVILLLALTGTVIWLIVEQVQSTDTIVSQIDARLKEKGITADSVKGEKGDDGATGAKGATGATGATGLGFDSIADYQKMAVDTYDNAEVVELSFGAGGFSGNYTVLSVDMTAHESNAVTFSLPPASGMTEGTRITVVAKVSNAVISLNVDDPANLISFANDGAIATLMATPTSVFADGTSSLSGQARLDIIVSQGNYFMIGYGFKETL